MAEQRRLADLVYGHLGTLTYIPREKKDGQIGVLHSDRNASSAEHFQVIGSLAELYPPSKTQIPEGSSRLWQERRVQKRWLLKSHPDAFMGNLPLEDLLKESMERFHKVEGEATDRPLLAIGQMTNFSDASRIAGLSALAVATGESGELLRLARIDESKWLWDDNKDMSLQLSVIDPEDREDEVVWASDGLPVSQIKFATSSSRYEPLRWLLVQKQTSTTILQPEYHKVPIARKTENDFYSVQKPSRIDPNPVLTISHKQTGGNAHVDAAFNPTGRGQVPQVAVIDECGYWSVWNISGSRKAGSTLSSSIDKCGHIQEGMLQELPLSTSYPAGKHGLLYVGTVKTDDFWDAEAEESEEGQSAVRSQHLLLWNREKFEVFDLVSNMALPKLPQFTTRQKKRDWILDIQLSPLNKKHIFVLTTRHVFWLDIFPVEKETNLGPRVLLACPHLIPGEGLRMSTCRATKGQDTSLVTIYAPKHRQIRIYWFSISSLTSLPQWHRQVITLPYDTGIAADSADIQSLIFHQAEISQFMTGMRWGPGSKYKHNGVHFYQGSILSKDLSVRYCICTASVDADVQIVLPNNRVGQSTSEKNRRWKRKRRHFLRRMGTNFVLPDSMSETQMQSLVKPKPRLEDDLASGMKTQGGMPVVLRYTSFFSILQGLVAEQTNKTQGRLPSVLLSVVREAVDEGMADGRLPLWTWREIAQQLGPAENSEVTDIDIEDEVRQLVEETDGGAIITQLQRQSPEGALAPSTSLASLIRQYTQIWVDPLTDKLSEEALNTRRGWIADIARDVFLSTFAVVVQDTPLFGSIQSDGIQSPEKGIASSSIPIKSSQSTTPGIPSSPASVSSVATPDEAMQRLRLLSPEVNSGSMGSAKSSSVLSYWPKERGVGTQDYVSSVAIASDRQFDEARQRLQRIEHRRRTQAEKYKLPAFKRPTPATAFRPSLQPERLPVIEQQPVPAQAMSSQQQVPDSSQSQGPFGPSVTMSQPVAGMFGDRKKTKKAKRKSGFR